MCVKLVPIVVKFLSSKDNTFLWGSFIVFKQAECKLDNKMGYLELYFFLLVHDAFKELNGLRLHDFEVIEVKLADKLFFQTIEIYLS